MRRLIEPGVPVVLGAARPAPQRQVAHPPALGSTNNAVVAGIVSAIVAGTISFLVAYYQSDDAARQAVFGQQAQVASQMETAAAVYYDTIMNDYNFWINCDTGDNLWLYDSRINGTY